MFSWLNTDFFVTSKTHYRNLWVVQSRCWCMPPFQVSPLLSFKHTLKSLPVTSSEPWKCWLEGFGLNIFNSNPPNSLKMLLFPQTAFSTWQLIGSFFLVSHPAGFLMTWDTYHIFYNMQDLRNENASQGQLSLATNFNIFSLSFCLHFHTVFHF